MKKFTPVLITSLILALALGLRLYHFTSRTPFDWDQGRDYHAVEQIMHGKSTLIGPVAMGEGGFFLGPLYYYLLTPMYYLTQASPLALPLTSIILDSLAVIGFVYLGFTVQNHRLGYAAGILWALSPLAIDSARISWNVALLPLWLPFFLSFLLKKPSLVNSLILGLLAGLAWHIHAAIIPLAIVLVLLARVRIININSILGLTLGYGLAVSPLILFDIRHAGLEHNLIISLFHGLSGVRADLSSMTVSVLSRFGKLASLFVDGAGDLNLSLGIVLTLASIAALFKSNAFIRLCAAATLTNLGLIILLGKLDFAEYYLITALICTFLIFTYYLLNWHYFILPALLVGILMLSHYQAQPFPYSLRYKIELSRAIASAKDVNLTIDLPIGRDSGITDLIGYYGGQISASANNHYLVTDKPGDSIIINGELASDIQNYGAFRVGSRLFNQ